MKATALISVIVVAVLGGVVVFAALTRHTPASGRRGAPRATTTSGPIAQPVLAALQRDVGESARVLLDDRHGCTALADQPALLTFAGGSNAAATVSWYIDAHRAPEQLERAECARGHTTPARTQTLLEVTGAPIVRCVPSCDSVQSIRLLLDTPSGLASIVAYKRAGR